jgi:UDP-N-acetylmuramate dehydrogenase
MNTRAPRYLPERYLPRVALAEPLARHTSWHVGGPAEVFYTPKGAAELGEFLAALPAEVPVHWLGLGSNLLVRDGGLKGVVICLHGGGFERLEREGATAVYAGAGLPCAKLARACVAWRLGPAEFFAGIPGTVGGALAMNAGAFGGETWRQVDAVEVVDRRGNLRTRTAAEYVYGYRHLEPPAAGEWFIGGRFRFAAQPEASNEGIQTLLDRRRQSQPIGAWSGGSTFVNPPGDHAARLIDSAGLKGYRIGGASVSEKHANFLVNHGHATGADLEQLLLHVQETVARVHGVRLVPEVRIVGEAS